MKDLKVFNRNCIIENINHSINGNIYSINDIIENIIINESDKIFMYYASITTELKEHILQIELYMKNGWICDIFTWEVKHTDKENNKYIKDFVTSKYFQAYFEESVAKMKRSLMIDKLLDI